MTHEQFITELATVNQAAADIQAEISRLFKAVNTENDADIKEAARELVTAAEVLKLSANSIHRDLSGCHKINQ